MVIAVWLHMFRVFMTGSYKPPREFNWSVGVILLVLTLLLSFTGYLLPWDQLAIWAIAVGSNMAGATPFLGAEGPGSSLLAIGDINFITKDDARFGLIGGRFLGEQLFLGFMSFALHWSPIYYYDFYGCSLLENQKGWRYFYPSLTYGSI